MFYVILTHLQNRSEYVKLKVHQRKKAELKYNLSNLKFNFKFNILLT